MLPSAGLDHGAETPLLFADHHRQLEAACETLRVCTYTDEPDELVLRFRTFERAVLEHLKAEEHEILPVYAKHAPADAEAIFAEHADLRRQLFQIGIDVELHCVRAEALEQLVSALRAHAKHEDRQLYPWAQAHLPPRTKRELLKRVIHSLQMLAFVERREKAPRPRVEHE
jgi:hemerythrin superfamily protein